MRILKNGKRQPGAREARRIFACDPNPHLRCEFWKMVNVSHEHVKYPVLGYDFSKHVATTATSTHLRWFFRIHIEALLIMILHFLVRGDQWLFSTSAAHLWALEPDIYMYTSVCIHQCVYTCMYTPVFIHQYVYLCMYTSVRIHLYVYICMYTSVCIHSYVYICMYTSVCIHLYVYRYTYIHTDEPRSALYV